mgnify:CR=1 FL=1|tara:strand:- start:35 stop:469 length:435 start_codon:yes stop_codon:yes gene_type:complete
MNETMSNSVPTAEEGIISARSGNKYQYMIRFPKHIREIIDRNNAKGGYFSAQIAEQLKNNWCAYVKVPKGHPMFGLALIQLEDSGWAWEFPVEIVELSWADHLDKDEEFWYFGWNYDRIQCPINQSDIIDDITQVIDWVDSYSK